MRIGEIFVGNEVILWKVSSKELYIIMVN